MIWWELGLDFAPSPLLQFCFVSRCLSWISLYWRLYSCRVSDESKDAVEYRAKRCCQNTRMLTMVAAPRFHLSAINPTSSVLTEFASSVGGALLTCIFLIHSFGTVSITLRHAPDFLCVQAPDGTPDICWPSPFWQSRVRVIWSPSSKTMKPKLENIP